MNDEDLKVRYRCFSWFDEPFIYAPYKPRIIEEKEYWDSLEEESINDLCYDVKDQTDILSENEPAIKSLSWEDIIKSYQMPFPMLLSSDIKKGMGLTIDPSLCFGNPIKSNLEKKKLFYVDTEALLDDRLSKQMMKQISDDIDRQIVESIMGPKENWLKRVEPVYVLEDLFICRNCGKEYNIDSKKVKTNLCPNCYSYDVQDVGMISVEKK